LTTFRGGRLEVISEEHVPIIDDVVYNGDRGNLQNPLTESATLAITGLPNFFNVGISLA